MIHAFICSERGFKNLIGFHSRLILFVLFIGISYVSKAQSPDFNWVSNGHQKNILRQSIQYDSKGNIYMIGMYHETVNVDPGGTDLTLSSQSSSNEDMFLLKYNSKGFLVKGVRIGGSNFKYAKEILVDQSGRLIISADFNGDIDFDDDGVDELSVSTNTVSTFIAQYDSDLNFNWAADMPGLHSMSLDANGNIYTILLAYGTITYGKKNASRTLTYNDYFVFVTLKPNGTIKSEFSLWSNDFQIVIQHNKIMVDADKNIYCSGYFTLSADFDPGAGSAVLKEVGRDSGTGFLDAFVVKYDSAGNFKWVKQIGGKYNERIFSLGISPSKELLFIGNSDGNIDVDPGPGVFNSNNKDFMVKLDQNGNFIWIKPCIDNVSYNLERKFSKFDKDDNMYMGGRFFGKVDFDVSASTYDVTSAGFNDVFIQKLSRNGDLVWVKTFGGVNEDRLLDFDVLDSNSMAFTAQFTNEVWLKSGSQLNKYTSACDSCANGFLIRATDFNGTGFKDITTQSNSFTVFPNPSVGNPLIQSSENGTLMVYNAIGQVLNTVNIEKDFAIELDLKFVDNGLYSLVLYTDKGMLTQKLVISH